MKVNHRQCENCSDHVLPPRQVFLIFGSSKGKAKEQACSGLEGRNGDGRFLPIERVRGKCGIDTEAPEELSKRKQTQTRDEAAVGKRPPVPDRDQACQQQCETRGHERKSRTQRVQEIGHAFFTLRGCERIRDSPPAPG